MINLRISDGALVYWTFGANTIFTNTNLPLGTFPNDPSTFAARYGNPPREEGHPEVRANFRVDAETLTGPMSAALARAAADPANPWGLSPGPNVAGEGYGYPTFLEQHDFAATQMPSGWISSHLKLKYHDPFVGSLPTIPIPIPISTPTVPTAPVPSGEIDGLKAELADTKEELAEAESQLDRIVDELDKFADEIPDTGRGKYAKAGRNFINELRKILIAVFIVIILTSLSGCAAWRALNPFDSVTGADAEWSGVKSGPVVGLTPTLAGATLDPQAAALAGLLGSLGATQSDPLGVLMPVSMLGDPAPRWILCTDEYKSKCTQIPLNAMVHFAGRPAGIFWKPSRLTADGFND